MIKVNLRDGRTLSFDLHCPDERAEWERCQADAKFQAQIRALAIAANGVMHTLPVPCEFARVAYTAELRDQSERINCQADDIALSITVYQNATKVTRTDLRRLGRPRFVPKPFPLPQARSDD